jgi:DNA-binding NarL/FixJ family response regulator
MSAHNHTPVAHKILIIDDHPVMRAGIAAVLSQEPDLSIRGEASNEEDSLQLARRLSPDLVIIDLSLSGTSGTALLSKLKHLLPDLRLLVLSMHDEHVHAEKCLRAGAHGYLMKDQAPATLVKAVRAVLNGELYVSDHMRTLLLKGLAQPKRETSAPPSDAPTVLTRAEWLVLELIGMGFSSRAIAEKLNRSVKTINAHRANIQQKLQLSDSAALVRYALNWTQQGPEAAGRREPAVVRSGKCLECGFWPGDSNHSSGCDAETGTNDPDHGANI